MGHQHILVFGCVTLTVVMGAFVLWGPPPRPKKKKGHIVGLVNLGSTCFLNTLLQALASCPIFVRWLSYQKKEEDSLTFSLHHVLWVLNGKGNGDVYAPVGVLSALKRHGWMASYGEQDAHELFNVIVSALQDENCKMQKLGSLSDVLPFSFASELEDFETSSLSPEPILEEEKIISITSECNDPVKVTKTIIDVAANYADAMRKMNSGDSPLQSSATGCYSLEGDSPVQLRSDCGALAGADTLRNENKDLKSNVSKCLIEKFKASQKSFKDKSPDFSGYYDRVTGCSPCVPKHDSPPFQGLLTSSLQCSVCGHCSSLRFDTFDSVSLPLNDNLYYQIQKLQDLLRIFVKTEIIADVECEKCCKKTAAFKTLSFGKLPPCLCLRIARTAWHSYSRTPTKREDFVDFPEYLPMDDYTVTASLRKDSSKMLKIKSGENLDGKETNYKHLYRLKSVVVHLGGVSSGHFLTYRRGALNTSKRHRWYLTSDDTVKLSTLYEALDSVAYMLFYEKCSPEQSFEETTNEPIPRKFCFVNPTVEDED